MWVTVALVSLAALIIILLCVPLNMVLRTDVSGSPKLHLRFSWLFGLVTREVTPGRKKPEEEKKVVSRRKQRGIGLRTVFQILRTKGLLRQSKHLISNVLGCLSSRNLAVNLKIGLDSPADTGLLFAVIGPAIALLRFPFPYEITVQPSFRGEAVVEGYSYGRVRLWPIKLVPPLFKFACSLPAFRATKLLVINKWRRKK